MIAYGPRRTIGGWLAAAAVFLLVSAPALVSVFEPVGAQSFDTQVLIKNLAKTSVNAEGNEALDAQRFTTGSNPAGYRVTSVRIALGDNGSDVTSSETYVVIRENNSSDRPGDKVMDLDSPSSISNRSTNDFTPADKLVLEPDTHYWIVTNDQLDSDHEDDRIAVRLTEDDEEDAGLAPGWNLPTFRRWKHNRSDTEWQWNTRMMRISVVGWIREDTGVASVSLTDPDGNPVVVNREFDPETRTYTATVPHLFDRLKVTATPKIAGDRVQALLGSQLEDVRGEGAVFDLEVGENEVTVFSRSDADDQTTEEYTIKVFRFSTPGAARQLVSNLDQRTTAFHGGYFAQGFTTGPNVGGYTITKVSVGAAGGTNNLDADGNTYVRISTSNANTDGPAVVADLENPASFSDQGTNVFTAPDGTTLDPGTRYWITVGTEDGKFNTRPASVGKVDDGNDFGWKMNADGRRRNNLEGASTSQWPAAIKIEGYPNVSPTDASVGSISLKKRDDANVDYNVYPNLLTADDDRDYVGWVPNSVTSLRLNASPAHEDATIRIRDDNDTSSRSRETAVFSDLVEGENEFQFTITAPDELTKRLYTVTVTRDPTTETFVSNAEAADSAGTTSGTAEQFAVSFRTSSTDSSVLKEFDVLLADSNSTIDVGSDNHSVRLERGGDEEPSGAVINFFSAPSSYVDDEYATFTGSSALSPDTTYWLIFNGVAANPSKPALTSSDDEDPGNLDGWTIGDTSVRRASTSDPWSSVSRVPAVRLRGESTSTDARLAGLVVKDADGNAGKINPDIDPDTPAYYVPVGNLATSVAFDVQPQHPGATVSMSLRGTGFAHGEETPELVVGRNTVEVEVTAADGTTQRVYSVLIERADARADLVSNLDVSGLTFPGEVGDVGINDFAQPFDTGSETAGYVLDEVRIELKDVKFKGVETITAYIYEVGSNNSSASSGELVAELISPDSFTEDAVNIFKVPPGAWLKSDQFYTVAFEATGNTDGDFEVSLINQNGQSGLSGWRIADGYRRSGGGLTTNSMRMRLRGDTLDGFDATLSGLTFTDADGRTIDGLSPEFDEDTTNYVLNVMNRVESLTLTATATEDTTTISISGDDDPSTPGTATFDLDVGANQINVTSTAPNGLSETYAIVVNRPSPPTAPTDCPSGTEWCTTIRVGRTTDAAGSAWGYFSSILNAGELEDDTFTYAGADYTVYTLNETENTIPSPYHGFQINLSNAVPAGTVLNLGGTALTFEDAGSFESWNLDDEGIDFDWDVGDLVTVSLDIPDPPGISIQDVTVDEGSAAQMTITLDNTWFEDVDITYGTAPEASDTATLDTTEPGGADYVEVSGQTVTIAAGDTQATVSFPTIGDGTDEDDEFFTVTASFGGDSETAEVTITDDDDPPEVDFVRPDSGSPSESSDLTLEVELSAISGKTITIDYITQQATTSDAATPGDDYVHVSDTLEIAPGDSSGTFEIDYVDDALDEPTERYIVKLTNPVNVTIPSAFQESSVSIWDNDDPPSITVDDATAGEGADVEFEVTLSAESGFDVSVGYGTSGGTATPGTDYTAPASGARITILAGQTTGTIRVPTIIDNTEEGSGTETFTLTLSAPANATLGSPSTATGTISDTAVPGVSFDTTNVTIAEGGMATYKARLRAEPSANVTLTPDGLSGTDVTIQPTTLTFTVSNWRDEQTFTLTAAEDDDSVDDPVTITHTTSGGGYGSVTVASVSVTVTDNDVPGVEISETEVTLTEGGSATYEVRLKTQPSASVTITPATPPGEPVTVTPASRTFTTSNWGSFQTFTVNGTQDTDKLDESGTITHSISGGDYATVAVDSVDFEIDDDDKTGPSAPLQLTATVGDRSVRLNWQVPSDDGGSPITGYEYRVDTGPWTATGGTGTTFTVTNLNNDQEYSLSVRGVNDIGNGVAAGPLMVTPTPVTLTIIPAPGGSNITEGAAARFHVRLSNSVSGLSFTISYEYQGDFATDAQMSTTHTYSGGGPITISVPTTNDNTVEADGTITATLETGTGYTVGIPSSATVNVEDNDVLGPLRAPSAPTNVEVTPGFESLEVSWTASEVDGNNAATNYKVDWNPGLEADVGSATEYTIGDLIPGVGYSVRVLAENAAGSASSSSIVAVPLAAPQVTAVTVDTPSIDDSSADVDVTFTNPDSESQAVYLRYRTPPNVGTWQDAPSLTDSGTEVTFNLTGLDSVSQYEVQSSLDTDYLRHVRSAMFTTRGPPSGLVLNVAPADEELRLRWSVDLNGGTISNQLVEWKSGTESYSSSRRFETTDPAVRAHTIENLVNGTVYTVRVTVTTNYSPAAVSNEVMRAPARGPSVSNIVISSIDRSSATATVSVQNLDLGVGSVGLHVRHRVESGTDLEWSAPTTRSLSRSRSTASEVFNLSGLSGNTGYEIQAVTTQGGVTADWTQSFLKSFMTLTSPPHAPAVSASHGDGLITVRWLPPANDGGSPITGYTIRWKSGSEIYATTRQHLTDANDRAHNVTDLTNGTEYAVQVYATNGLGAGRPAEAMATPSTVPRSAPTSVLAAECDGSLHLSWDAPADDGGIPVVSYTVQWKGTDESYGPDREALADADDLMHTIASLNNGEIYTIRIIATNDNGDGEDLSGNALWSEEITATPREGTCISNVRFGNILADSAPVIAELQGAEDGIDVFMRTRQSNPGVWSDVQHMTTSFGDASVTFDARDLTPTTEYEAQVSLNRGFPSGSTVKAFFTTGKAPTGGAFRGGGGGSIAPVLRIEPAIASVNLRPGDEVQLAVNVYGRQDLLDNGLADRAPSAGRPEFAWTSSDGGRFDEPDIRTGWGNSIADDRRVIFTAPDSPGTFTVTAALIDVRACLSAQEDETADDRERRCSAIFEVTVIKRSTMESSDRPVPLNPPGTIPETLTDSDGTAYAVFTPEDGGEFIGEGFSFSADAGAVANGEFVGVAVREAGPTAETEEAWHRFEFAGASYAIAVVDGDGETAAEYALNEAGRICLPLPAELRSNISKIAVTSFSEPGGFTVLATTVKIAPDGVSACGAISSLPAVVAVAAVGGRVEAADTVEAEGAVSGDDLPDTGGAPAASVLILILLFLGSVLIFGGTIALVLHRAGWREIPAFEEIRAFKENQTSKTRNAL